MLWVDRVFYELGGSCMSKTFKGEGGSMNFKGIFKEGSVLVAEIKNMYLSLACLWHFPLVEMINPYALPSSSPNKY